MAVEHPFKPLFKPDLNPDLTREMWVQLIDRYLNTQYKDGARGPEVFDCWGMLRDILLKSGAPESVAPSFGRCSASNKAKMTQYYREIIRNYTPEPKAQKARIAAAFSGNRLDHVGFVVPDGSQLAILHTTARFGGHITPVHLFEPKFSEVKYYACNFLL
jgi:hypothetical protein